MGLRQERLADEIRDLLATCFLGSQMRDPRLEGVSITHVKVSADLQLATAYFRLYNHGPKDQAKVGLERSKGFLRKHLAQNLKLRRVPELRFFYDESVEHGSRIEALLHQAKN
ncbi:MAG: 30S ribosome-binding factor RbfA [Oligoflexales bacterium]